MTGDSVHYIRISETEPLPVIGALRPCRAIVVLDAPYSDEWQDKVSRWLVDSGCLYMMAWGPNCSSWDDSVDYAQIQKFPDGAPDTEFVMTTWHDKELLEEVFWYATHVAFDPFDRITHNLVVHVGQSDREKELLSLFQYAQTFHERCPD